MSMTKDNIIIQQCLHGYDQGHCLIESSVKLPKESASLILRMSDASSIGYMESSPSYLTGYPLPEIGSYALAKTWPAKDMPRPGCVWTHTIFIKFEDLALFNDLGVLDQIFKTPDNKDFEFFNKTIKLNESIQGTLCEKGSKSLVSSILNALYLKSEPHILLPTSPDSKHSVLSVWSKQWPKFRRNFKFRTYSSKSSTLNEYFDLCFSDSPTYKYDDDCFKTSEQKIINILLDDIFDFSNDGLKEFLWRYGADSKGLRDSYMPLVQVYYDLISTLNCNDSESFNLHTSNILKHTITSKSLEKHIFTIVIQAEYSDFTEEIIDFILKKITDLKPTELTIHLKDFSNFFAKIPFMQVRRFLYSKLNDEELFNSLVSHLPNETLIGLVNETPDILLKILKAKPFFVLESLVIKLLNSQPQLIKDVSFEESVIISKFISKSIELELWPALVTLNEQRDNEFLPHFLDTLKNLSYQKIELVTENVILKNTSLVKDILTSNTYISLELLSAISKGLSVREFDNSKLDPWLSALCSINLKQESLPESLALYLLIRGLENIGSHPHLLLTISFDTVHHSIALNRLSINSWDKLNKLLPIPNYFFWDYWDRCKKLRNGLIQAYRKHKMPIDKFIYTTEDKTTLKYLLIELESGYENKYFLKDLLTYITENEINIDDDFSNIRLQYLQSN